MMSTEDRNPPGPETSDPDQDESAKQRDQIKSDKAWDKSERDRREAEIQRRVKEQWRGSHA